MININEINFWYILYNLGFSRSNKRIQMARIRNTLRQHGWPDSHKSFAKIAKREYHFRHGIPFGKWTKF